MTLSSPGRSSKENDFAQKVLETFKTKNFDKYQTLTINGKDFEELLNDIQQHERIERHGELKDTLNKFNKERDSAFKKEFNRIIEKGEELGIDWIQVSFSKFVFQTDNPSNSSKTSLSGHINFTYKGTTYVLFGVEATELSGGYKLNMLRALQRGGIEEYVDPDLMDDADI